MTRARLALSLLLTLGLLACQEQSLTGDLAPYGAASSFSLIDAETDQPVAGYDPIPHGATLELSTLPKKLNVRANVAAAGSVRFALNGNANFRTENAAPYALAGDVSGDYFVWAPKPGTYQLSATPYTQRHAKGGAGAPLRLDFTVVEIAARPNPEPELKSFTLIDAQTDRPVAGYDPIPAGATLVLDTLPEELNIRANVSSTSSVRFALNGNANFRTESASPYALAGDNRGDYLAWSPEPGDYRVTATPYAGDFAKGQAGVPLSLDLEVVATAEPTRKPEPTPAPTPTPEPALGDFTLINARTNQPVAGFDPIAQGATLELSTLPEGLNIRANVASPGAESVQFKLNGDTVRTESAVPYALASDARGNYAAWSPKPGSYQLTATPYTKDHAKGEANTPLKLSFTVTGAASEPDPRPDPQPDPQPKPAPGNLGPELTYNCGRIAWSSDGNQHDPDDIGASAMALLLLAERGQQGRLAHYDHSSHLGDNDPSMEQKMITSVEDTARRTGYDMSRIYNDQRDLEGSTDSIAQAIDASSANNRLCFVVAGPHGVAYRGIAKADPSKFKHVTMISHAYWNNTHDDADNRFNLADIKRDFPGLNYQQIRDQNGRNGLGTSVGEVAWEWMKRSDDPDIRWVGYVVNDVMNARGDVSDAGMMWYVLQGDEYGNPSKFRGYLE